MFRKRLSRYTTILTAATLALMLVGVAGVTAKTPSWSLTAVKLPPTVAAGKDAGYHVTVRNDGPSNINALSLTVTPAATPNATPSYFSGLAWNQGGPGSCSASGKLVCDLGTVTAGTVITFTVAYAVPSGTNGTFDVVFALQSASGNTGNDRGGNSRGDALKVTAKTGIGSSTNFSGGFVVGDTTYANDQSVGRRNPQASTVESPATLIPVTIEDGITTGIPCTIGACDNAFGEWTNLNVDNGSSYGSPFKVTLFVWGGAIPGGIQPGDVFVLHTLDDGSTVLIDTPCSPATGTPTNAECLTVTKVGNNYRIVIWLFQNGSLRGTW